MISVEHLADDVRYRRHNRAVTYVGGMINSLFGVQLSQETLHAWSLANMLTRDIDNIFDGSDSDLQRQTLGNLHTIFESPNWREVSLVNESSTALAHGLRAAISDEQAAKFVQKGFQLIDMAKEIKESSNVDNYSYLKRLEGQMMVTMMLQLVSKEELKLLNRSNAAKFLRVGNRILNSYDSAVDFEADYKSGVTRISPSRARKIYMLTATGGDIQRSSSYIKKRKLPKLVRPFIAVAKDRHRQPELETV